jgi:hypothetical protein
MTIGVLSVSMDHGDNNTNQDLWDRSIDNRQAAAHEARRETMPSSSNKPNNG